MTYDKKGKEKEYAAVPRLVVTIRHGGRTFFMTKRTLHNGTEQNNLEIRLTYVLCYIWRYTWYTNA
jgi:hypothetical protein